MALPVVYRQTARREIINIARTYEGQRQGMGGLFLNEIGRIEAHISDGPRLYQLVVGGVRRAVLIVVLACLDLRRDPETITSTVATRRS